MARDYIEIGSTPAGEDCAQVGSEGYERRARAECLRFIELIRKKLGPQPEGARLSVKSNPHDFGSYLSVVCFYDDTKEQAVEYAFRCEREAPTRWEAPATPALADRPAQPRLCDSCRSAAAEEVGADGEDAETAELLMSELGSDVADHCCDEVEAPGVTPPCTCACGVQHGRRTRAA